MSKDDAIRGEVREVEIERIAFNPYQPRRAFEENELQELSLSIKNIGLIHPPVVRPLPADSSGRPLYELISGERRFRAAQLAGLITLPVVIRATSPCLSAQAALIENIQRVDLNPMEIASGLDRLMDEFGFNQEQLAQRIGKKRSTIANYLRLITLPESIQESLRNEHISMGHAKVILSLEIAKQQSLLLELILRDELSVRKTEELAKKLQEKKEPKPKVEEKEDLHLSHLAEQLQKRLGTKVVIQGKENKGRLSIDYYSLDDLDRILNALGLEE